MNEKLKKLMPHVLAIVLFLGLSGIYFSPVITEDKDLRQDDLENMVGWGKDLKDYHAKTGDYAFWSNTMFSGMPHNYTFMATVHNIFEDVGRVFRFNLPINHIGTLFAYMFGFYIFLISIGCKPLLGVVGAIAYAFSTYNLIILEVGHVNKGLVMATMAPIIGGIILTYRKKYLWGAIISFVFTGINVAWDHQQISYYLVLMILTLAVVYLIYAIREKTMKDYFKSSLILIVAALIGIAPGVGKLMSTADYSKDTMRGGSILKNQEDGTKESTGLDIEYAFRWSYGKGETMTLLIPGFYGASSVYNVGDNSAQYDLFKKSGYSNSQAAQRSKYATMYWGDQPGTRGPSYAGAIVCFLFVLGLFILKGHEKWWLLTATILSIILSWGKNFELVNDFLFYHLPLYNKFRTPSMALTVAEVTMAAMAVLALKEILYGSRQRSLYLKPIFMAAGITGGICLIYALFGGGLMSFSGYHDAQFKDPELLSAIVADRKSLLASDSWRSLFLIVLAAGALWYFIRHKVKISYVLAIIGVLILVDLWMVDKRFLNEDSYVPKQKVRAIVPTDVDRQILLDPDVNYRVLNLAADVFNESRTSYFHQSIGGYSPTKLQRYQDIIDHHFAGSLNFNVLNMLNTKYIIFPDQQSQQLSMHYNDGALGNVWFVNELKWVASPDEEIVALQDFNPLQTAFIETTWQNALPGWEALQHEEPDSTAFIRLSNYANPGHLFYESSSERPQLAVFSEVYYQTWHAYIDGVEAPLVRVNYILRGLQVPAGSHKIEFKCIDEIYLKGAKMSKAASIVVGAIILLLLAFAAWDALGRKLPSYRKIF